MPFYEYVCEYCGHECEVLQKISDKPLRKCPQCEKDGLKKMISATSFRLKGGGWYETDFKNKKKPEDKKKDNVKGDKEQKANTTAKDSEGKASGNNKDDTNKSKQTKTKQANRED